LCDRTGLRRDGLITLGAWRTGSVPLSRADGRILRKCELCADGCNNAKKRRFTHCPMNSSNHYQCRSSLSL
jgi:hypothetical protein